MKQETKKISHYTRFRDELRAEADRLGISRGDLIERSIEHMLSQTPDRCCMECGCSRCSDGTCVHKYSTKAKATKAGACDSCRVCIVWVNP